MTASHAPPNYVEFFKNPVDNPLGHGERKKTVLGSIYHGWRVAGAPVEAGELLKIVLNNFDSKAIGGLGIFVTDADGQHRLRVIHGIRRYSGPLGLPSPLTNKVFGYLGDVSPGGFVEIVQVDEALFSITGEVNVCTIAHHKQTLASDETIEIFKVRGDTAPASEVVRTRHSAFIPYELMPLLLPKALTARQAFETIEAHLSQNDMLEVCAPLLSFLRVAGTLHTGDTVLNALPQAGAPFRLETDLMEFMQAKVLLRDLVHFRKPLTTSDPATAVLQATLQTMADRELRRDAANERQRAEEDQPTTIKAAFGEHITEKLLALCHKDNTDELPSIYERIANKNKREDYLTIIQESIGKASTALQLPGTVIVTPAVMSFIKSFRLYGIDESDVASGVLPMSFVPPGSASTSARARSIEDSEENFGYVNMMGTENQHISSADARQLSRSKGYVVQKKWAEATVQVEAYQAVLYALLGSQHPTTRAYQKGVRYYKRIALQFQDALDHKVGENLAPALLVYVFQLKVRAWLEEQWTFPEDVCPAPDFTDKLREYQSSKNLGWLPEVAGVPLLNKLQRRVTPVLTPAAPRAGASAGGTSGSRPSATPPPRTDPPQQRITNNEVDPRLLEDNAMCKHIKEWRVRQAIGKMEAKGKGIPLRADGRPCCITWRTKAACFSGCSQVHDHNKGTVADADTFFNWCKEAYA